jgi:hypothetical protein
MLMELPMRVKLAPEEPQEEAIWVKPSPENLLELPATSGRGYEGEVVS